MMLPTLHMRLLLAIEADDVAEVRAVLAEGADVDERSSDSAARGFTPLYLAVLHDRPEVARALIDGGADLELRDRPGGEEIRGSFGEVATPLDMKDPRQPFGHTALALAVGLGRNACADVLIAAGADVDTRDDLGDAPIDIAARNQRPRMIERLLAAGCRTDHRGAAGPVLFATYPWWSGLECGLLLVRGGVKADSRYQGQTLLHLAARILNHEMVDALLDSGADPRRLNQEGKRAYDLAQSEVDSAHPKARLDDWRPTGRRLARLSSGLRREPTKADLHDDWPDHTVPVQLPVLNSARQAEYEEDQVAERLRQASLDAGFQQVVAELERRCSAAARPFRRSGLSIKVARQSELRQSKTSVEALQREFADRRVYLLGESSVRRGIERIYLLATRDLLEVVRFFFPPAVDDPTANGRLMEFVRTHPVIPDSFRQGLLRVRFDPIPEDLERLACEIFSLCPDILEFYGTKRQMIDSLRYGWFVLC